LNKHLKTHARFKKEKTSIDLLGHHLMWSSIY
jgi:hypothetical protein